MGNKNSMMTASITKRSQDLKSKFQTNQAESDRKNSKKRKSDLLAKMKIGAN